MVACPGKEAKVAGPILLNDLWVGVSWHLQTECGHRHRLPGAQWRATGQRAEARGQPTSSRAQREPLHNCGLREPGSAGALGSDAGNQD